MFRRAREQMEQEIRYGTTSQGVHCQAEQDSEVSYHTIEQEIN